MPDDRKVALVIGNGAYTHASKLDAPRRDAIGVASLLERIGFSVVAGFDCDYYSFRDLAEDFYDRLDPQALALFYYSGHGAQGQDGGNHMLPVDARLVDPRDLGRVTLPLNGVLAAMRGKARVSLILLDACRDDPFEELSRTTGTKSVFAGRPGLAAVPRASLGQALIGFAAEEGHTAFDAGGGQPSPFTAALVRHLGTPGKDIRDILGDVRRDVFAATDGRQTPWTKEALTEEVVLVAGDAAVVEQQPVTGGGFGGPGATPVTRTGTAPQIVHAPPMASVSRRDTPLRVAAFLLLLFAVGVVSFVPKVLCHLPGISGVNACLTATRLVPLVAALDSANAATRLDAQTRLADAFGTAGLDPTEQRRLAQELLLAASLERMVTLTPDARYGLVLVLAEIPAATWQADGWAATLTAATSLYHQLSDAVASGQLEIRVVRQSHLDRFGENIGVIETNPARPGTLLQGSGRLLVNPGTELIAPGN